MVQPGRGLSFLSWISSCPQQGRRQPATRRRRLRRPARRARRVGGVLDPRFEIWFPRWRLSLNPYLSVAESPPPLEVRKKRDSILFSYPASSPSARRRARNIPVSVPPSRLLPPCVSSLFRQFCANTGPGRRSPGRVVVPASDRAAAPFGTHTPRGRASIFFPYLTPDLLRTGPIGTDSLEAKIIVRLKPACRRAGVRSQRGVTSLAL